MRFAVLGALVVAVGCFSPSFEQGLACSEGELCPTNLTCVSGICVRPGTELVDAGADAAIAPLDCTGTLDFESFFPCVKRKACSDIHAQCYGHGPQDECEDSGLGLFGLWKRDDTEHIEQGIREGTITFNASGARTCLDSVGALGCNQPFTFDCGSVFTGAIAEGASCFVDAECATPLSVCDLETCSALACCAGTCLGPAELGEDCTAAKCIDGARCFGLAPTCQTGETGSPCGAAIFKDANCDPEFHCAGDATCQPDLVPDASCVADNQCPAGYGCVGNNLSGSLSGLCQPRGALDDPCDVNSCTGGLKCTQVDPAQLGTCTPQPLPGESCIVNEVCRGQRICPAGGVCPPPGGVGDPCMFQNIFVRDCAIGLFCTASIGTDPGTCQPLASPGTACGSDADCESDICNPAGKTCEATAACY